MINDFTLSGKVAIVTGAAAGGIGDAYARALAEVGAAVVCADTNLAGAEAVAASIVATGGRSIAVQTDISNEASANAMAAAAVDAFGGVDILINNAALMMQIVAHTAMEFPLDMWDSAFNVNVKGSWLCARAVAPFMALRGGGSIVNQSSLGAFPAESVYGITKVAVIGLTTTLARELGPLNINVNCIAPGLTQSVAGAALTADGSPYAEMMKARAAMRHKGSPEELCGALLLFVSPAGRWITGQVLNVDGGIALHT
jgi:NAD(P)-dependent dehydrogenase (short-subunit alcohol dehydrogenase family)